MLRRRRVRVLHDDVRLPHARVDVALAPLPVHDDVRRLRRLVQQPLERGHIRVDEQFVPHRLFRIGDGGQLLVLDAREFDATLRDLLVVRDDRRDLLADEPDFALREHGHVRDAAPPAHIRGDVGAREDGVNARKRARRIRVHRQDAGVRIRAADGLGPERLRNVDVGPVDRRARHLVAPVNAGHGHSDDALLGRARLSGHPLAPPFGYAVAPSIAE